jgi:hypothetical protein
MTNKIIVVTEPDDIFELGKRILVVDLNINQSHELSESLKNLDINDNLIVYKWTVGNNVDWCIDKMYKSNLIFFNAESQNQTLIGFLSAQKNTAYFGNLMSLNKVNKSVIYDKHDCLNFLNQKLTYE